MLLTQSAPDTPWPHDFSSAQNHYITTSGYKDSSFIAPTGAVPEIPEGAEDLVKNLQQGLSGVNPDALAEQYLSQLSGILDKVQGLDMSDPTQLMEALGQLQGASSLNPLAGLTPPGTAPPGAAQPSAPSVQEQLGVTEKAALVTKSNYDNFLAHKINFGKYRQKVAKELKDKTVELGNRFTAEMASVREAQRKRAEAWANQHNTPESVWRQRELQMIRERNGVRDKYVREYGSWLTSFYRSHVKPTVEKMENTEALYIKNMANKSLKKTQAEQMRSEANVLVELFARAQAPVDAFEPENDEVKEQIRRRTENIKAQAPQDGQTLPQLQPFEQQQRTLLEKIYEDAEYEAQAGLVKLTYKNAELTLGLNDPFSNQYLDLGVNIKDFSASLTEGEGWECAFKIGTVKEASVTVGAAAREAGQKTTLFFDDSLNVVDAAITKTPASQGLSVELGAGPAKVKAESTTDGAAFSGGLSSGPLDLTGEAKLGASALGTNALTTSLKGKADMWTVYQKQYKEDLEGQTTP